MKGKPAQGLLEHIMPESNRSASVAEGTLRAEKDVRIVRQVQQSHTQTRDGAPSMRRPPIHIGYGKSLPGSD